MHHFHYRNGELCAEDVPLSRIAADVGTPFYCYSTATLERHYSVFAGAFEEHGQPALVCYSVKANGNLAVIKTLARLGAGADVVSGGELQRALAAGIPPEKIVFSGVGKTRNEMAAALDVSIHQFNVESEPELRALNEVALSRGQVAPITFRVNPDVDAKTHAKISTGRKENKFGIPWTWARDVYGRAAQLPGVRIVGVDVHIGSQLTDLGPLESAFERIAGLVGRLRADGHAIGRLDLGGGLGIPYDDETPPLPADYARMIARKTHGLGCSLILEPGRVIVGNAGVLVARVLYVKEAESRTFVILDGAMNDLMRPALYDAHHRILPVREAPVGGQRRPFDVVGPVCETTDTFAVDRQLPELEEGDLVALLSAGAYGAVLSSTYNARPLTPEVLVREKSYSVVRKRPSFKNMIALESVPSWLKERAKVK